MYSARAFCKKRPKSQILSLFLQFIGKLSLILTNYTWLERGDLKCILVCQNWLGIEAEGVI